MITKNLQIFGYVGADLDLASAAFKNQIRILFRLNAAGTAWQSFNPASGFNALTKLEDGLYYFIDAASLPIDIPGAVVTAAVAVPDPVLNTYSVSDANIWDSTYKLVEGEDTIRSPFAAAVVQLGAGETQLDVEASSEFGAADFSQLGIIVNDVAAAPLQVTGNNGKQWYAVPDLPEEARVEVRFGYLDRSSGSFSAVLLHRLRMGGASALVAPTAPLRRVLFIHDSILAGPTSAVVTAAPNLLRQRPAVRAAGWRVTNEGYSARRLADDFHPSIPLATRNATLDRIAAGLDGTVENLVVLQAITNDLGLDNAPVADALAMYTFVLDGLRTRMASKPGPRITAHVPFYRGTPGNSTLEKFAELRTAITALPTGRTWLKTLTIPLVDADLSDTLHPNVPAHATKLLPAYEDHLLNPGSEEPSQVYVTEPGYVPAYFNNNQNDFNPAVVLKDGAPWALLEQLPDYVAGWGFYAYGRTDTFYGIYFEDMDSFTLSQITSIYGGDIEALVDGVVVASGNTFNAGGNGKRTIVWTLASDGTTTEDVPLPPGQHLLVVRQSQAEGADPGTILSYDQLVLNRN